MKTAIDPVCGMKADPDQAPSATHNGNTYYFCSQKCQRRFQENPDSFSLESAEASREPGRGSRLADYLPLGVLLSLLAATALELKAADWSWTDWMHNFMGLFLVVFAMFKLFDLKGFVNGFAMYDLLARRLRAWGYVYPFLELALGLAYLAHWQPFITYAVTAGLLVFGALGVVSALRRGLDIECACMGTVLQVPLSTVALVEDLGMAGMAGAMLAMRF